HHVVVDARGAKAGAILWECKNTRHWSNDWIAKLKQDQRALHADLAVLVTACLPKGCTRFAIIDGVLVSDFACAASLAAVLRSHQRERLRQPEARLTRTGGEFETRRVGRPGREKHSAHASSTVILSTSQVEDRLLL